MFVRLTFLTNRLPGKLGILDKALAGVTVAAIICALGFFSYTLTGQAGLLIVKSGSMAPAMPAGSLIVFRPADLDDVLNGEIIVFKERQSSAIISHRAVEKVFEDGSFYVKTQGDKNGRPDNELVASDNLMGKAALVIPRAGYILAYTKTTTGTLVLSFALAFLVMLIIVDKVRAKERTRAAMAYGAIAAEGVPVNAIGSLGGETLNQADKSEHTLVNPAARAGTTLPSSTAKAGSG